MSILILLVLLGLIAFHLRVRYDRIGRAAANVPGPFALPFFGNVLSFDISSGVKLWQTMRKITNEYYPVTRVWTPTHVVFSIRHPDDMEILLSSQKTIEKGFAYDYFRPWLKQGLLLSEGKKWHHRRQILTPAFHFTILRKYLEIAQEHGASFVQQLRARGRETVESLVPLCSKLTLNIICEAAMGITLDRLEEKELNIFLKATHKMGQIITYRATHPMVQDWFLRLMPFLKICRVQKQAVSVLDDFTNKIIKERREYHESTEYKYLQNLTDDVADEDHVYVARKKRLAFLDLLLAAERDGLIDETGINEEVNTFIFGGHDTTGSGITFILLLLAEHKDAQDKARAEITEIWNKTGGKIGMKEIGEFHYLERCIKEAFRLFPPVHTILRQVSEDIQLKHLFLPKGSDIVLHFFDLHRDSNFWSEPEKYDPDRFLVENTKGRHPFAYLPFSAGPRNCIGQRFAMPEVKALMGLILYNFYLEPVDRTQDIEILTDLILRPSKPVHVKFVQIERKA